MKKNKVKIIAEDGVNHNGSIKLAKKLVDCASKMGADYVKFQTFEADDLATESAPKAYYQKINTRKGETQYQMLKRLELSKKDHVILKKYCKKRKINFLSSCFSISSFNFLHKIGLKTIKIPSGEINNVPFLEHIGKYKKEIILSSGMSSLLEVSKAIKILLEAGTPKKNLTILHCNTEYPTPFSDVNLKAMSLLKEKFQCEVGYSDHTNSIAVPIAAVALGARVIEKHLTLNKNMKGPDHKASIEPKDFKNMVKSIRNIETSLGIKKKFISKSEKKNILIARPSIVAKEKIFKGEVFTEKNLTVKRPGDGISPMRWNKILGKKAKQNFRK